MLMIKLSKVGKNKKKVFRLIISEKSRDPFGRVLENLGSYNPYSKELIAKEDRIKHWLEKGAQMTATVNNLLVSKNVISGEKVIASKPGKKSEKRLAQIKAKQEKKASATIPTETITEEKAETNEVVEEKKEETTVNAE
ncbi:MAG: small subunit ribosomal protein [Patescibacteria group bacterium]|nr:small subunit ribosomal protein [Patescibacteria group bacterium]